MVVKWREKREWGGGEVGERWRKEKREWDGREAMRKRESR